MSDPFEHPLVVDYLKRFDVAARTLDPLSRSRLREELLGHLHEATAPTMSDSQVLAALTTLGTPEEIVTEELANHSSAGFEGSLSTRPTVRILLAVLAVGAGIGALVVMVPSAIAYLTAPGLYFSAFVWTLGGLLTIACVVLAIAAARYGRATRMRSGRT